VKLQVDAALQNTTPRELWRKMTREERRQFKGLGRIPHDFRRTAVRNLVRAGVSQKVAMGLTGHLTPSVFERYNITDDRDRRDAVAKLAATAAIGSKWEQDLKVPLDEKTR
jgi:integrase